MTTKKNPLLPKYCTIVSPNEYPIEEQMKSAVNICNKEKTYMVEMDIGKVIGLYLDWKKLKEEKKENKDE